MSSLSLDLASVAVPTAQRPASQRPVSVIGWGSALLCGGACWWAILSLV